MIAVLFGLLGALAIGTSDCVARVTARRVALISLTVIIFGLGATGLALWCWAADVWPRWDPAGWRDAVVSAAFNVVGLALLYAALARGPVALASPTVSAFSILVVAMNALSGEPFGWAQGVAAGLVFLGIARLARSDRRVGAAPRASAALVSAQVSTRVSAQISAQISAQAAKTSPASEPDDGREAMEDPAHLRGTLLLALAAAATIAFRMFLAQEATARLGAVEALLVTRVAAFLLALIALVAAAASPPRRASLRLPLWPPRALWPAITIQAVLESVALAAFLVGGEGAGGGPGDRVGAAIGFSAFAAVSPIVAWVWLGDPLSPRRLFWILAVVAGVALAALSAPA